jgi:hypothetical protein
MKIKNKTSAKDGSFDFENEKPKWVEDALSACDGRIPVMTRNRSDVPKAKVGISVMQRLVRLAEIMRHESPRFGTAGEVHRAAHYLGMSILYELFIRKDAEVKAKYESFYEAIQAEEELLADMLQLDDFSTAVKNMRKAFQWGLLKPEQLEKKVNNLVSAVPKRLQKIARQKVGEVLDKGTVKGMFTNSWGGKRSEKGNELFDEDSVNE